MITVTFSDGQISHKVHTREEALNLIERYWPKQDVVKNLDFPKEGREKPNEQGS
ncbi:Uncharacterised protein [Enterococcus casseliflavus]|uniref:hypothetical protein n=1 Tax=Enterococcus casseliflavus TaxID=37734 RepID=UPI000DFDC9A0|nr:hypothetical protein [Enterococcus casseliflavus]GEB30128.1 hypothetical protein ECA02_32230 [Enterococcus casseliflavus]STP33039.1 Uncharacterised protein [Enterococcus casseliflavus]